MKLQDWVKMHKSFDRAAIRVITVWVHTTQWGKEKGEHMKYAVSGSRVARLEVPMRLKTRGHKGTSRKSCKGQVLVGGETWGRDDWSGKFTSTN